MGTILNRFFIPYQNCLDLRCFGDDSILTSRVFVTVGRNRDFALDVLGYSIMGHVSATFWTCFVTDFRSSAPSSPVTLDESWLVQGKRRGCLFSLIIK